MDILTYILLKKDKLDIQQGEENAGKILKVDEDGKIALSEEHGAEFVVVTTLPTVGEISKIYLVANGRTGGNSYDEYIGLTESQSGEKIGTTDIDLSDYQKASELTAISNSEIDAIINGE